MNNWVISKNIYLMSLNSSPFVSERNLFTEVIVCLMPLQILWISANWYERETRGLERLHEVICNHIAVFSMLNKKNKQRNNIRLNKVNLFFRVKIIYNISKYEKPSFFAHFQTKYAYVSSKLRSVKGNFQKQIEYKC